jgi:single-stranded-DNA-specific exonuclease
MRRGVLRTCPSASACLLSTRTTRQRTSRASSTGLNRERREIESTMQDEAPRRHGRRRGGRRPVHAVHVRPQWHQGVVGSWRRASRTGFTGRVRVRAREHGELRGSGRSIAGFHLRDALDAVRSAPPTPSSSSGPRVRRRAHAARGRPARLPRGVRDGCPRAPHARAPRPHLESDGSLDRGELDIHLARLLRDNVWGQGLPPPTFDDTFEVLSARIVGLASTRSSRSSAPASGSRRSCLPPVVSPADAAGGGLPARGQNALAGHRGLQLPSETGGPHDPDGDPL